MGQALYRKYRSKSLGEIVGQEHITTALSNALKQGRVSHAYLFTGPRGVGKTSIARILAHEVNGLPYQEESTHLDIIEIDAASNRRIDEIRELRERVHSAPTSAKYKVYIIDEVHMLTREAFNALLKTLEEPPAHAIFILATTEAHKLPETIISRTQRFSFRPVEQPVAVSHLQFIAKQEGIKVSIEALQLMAEHGGGSFRDSISLLDQAQSAGKKIELSDVQSLLGIAPAEVIAQLTNTLHSNSASDVLNCLRNLREQGLNPASIAKQLGGVLREQLLEGKSENEESKIISLMKELLEVPASSDPQTALEISLLSAVLVHGAPKILAAPVAKQVPEPIEVPVSAVIEPIEEAPPSKPDHQPLQKPVAAISTEGDSNIWHLTLEALKKKHNTLYGVARMAVAELNGEQLTLIFQFPFHQKRLSEAKNQQIISDIIKTLTGASIAIKCIVDTANRPEVGAIKAATKKADPAIETISNIFGPSEVLE